MSLRSPPELASFSWPTSAPRRIVCLTEEPTEWLYLLGQDARIVGISAYTERPPEARRDKPVVSAFVGGSVKKIKALKPDLILGFSDIQAQLAHDLIKANLQVLIFNQRSIQEILDALWMMALLVDEAERGRALLQGYVERLARARERTLAQPIRPRVYFEEWDEPLICSIQWVSQLIELAGGQNVFADRAAGQLASERFVTHDEIIARDPQVILASWCGKPVELPSIAARPGYERVEAVRHGRLHELDPAIILQPGPASLTAGLDALEAILRPLGQGGATDQG